MDEAFGLCLRFKMAKAGPYRKARGGHVVWCDHLGPRERQLRPTSESKSPQP